MKSDDDDITIRPDTTIENLKRLIYFLASLVIGFMALGFIAMILLLHGCLAPDAEPATHSAAAAPACFDLARIAELEQELKAREAELDDLVNTLNGAVAERNEAIELLRQLVPNFGGRENFLD